MQKKKKNKYIRKTRARKKKAAAKQTGRKNTSRKAQKKTVRGAAEFPALEKRFFSRIKQEYFDIDYINTLTDSQKKYLDKFLNEYLGANMNPSKHRKGKLHKSKSKQRQVYNANNARNRDIYSIAKATGTLSYGEKDTDFAQSKNIQELADVLGVVLNDELINNVDMDVNQGWYNPEDAIIAMIDSKKKL